jgi:Triosephosphate isomerase
MTSPETPKLWVGTRWKMIKTLKLTAGSPRAVLYGGGVNPQDATDLLGDPNLHGLFVGRVAGRYPATSKYSSSARPSQPRGAGQVTMYSRTLPWSATAALL